MIRSFIDFFTDFFFFKLGDDICCCCFGRWRLFKIIDKIFLRLFTNIFIKLLFRIIGFSFYGSWLRKIIVSGLSRLISHVIIIIIGFKVTVIISCLFIGIFRLLSGVYYLLFVISLIASKFTIYFNVIISSLFSSLWIFRLFSCVYYSFIFIGFKFTVIISCLFFKFMDFYCHVFIMFSFMFYGLITVLISCSFLKYMDL